MADDLIRTARLILPILDLALIEAMIEVPADITLRLEIDQPRVAAASPSLRAGRSGWG